MTHGRVVAAPLISYSSCIRCTGYIFLFPFVPICGSPPTYGRVVPGY